MCAHTSGGMKGTFQPSANSAQIRSVTFSPPPPIQIGNRSCTGFGSHAASRNVKNSPSKLVRSCVSSPRTHWMYSFELAQPLAGRAVGDAVDVVLLLQPAAAEAEHGAALGNLVERRDRVGEHGRVPVARGVHQRTALHPLGRRPRARCAT